MGHHPHVSTHPSSLNSHVLPSDKKRKSRRVTRAPMNLRPILYPRAVLFVSSKQSDIAYDKRWSRPTTNAKACVESATARATHHPDERGNRGYPLMLRAKIVERCVNYTKVSPSEWIILTSSRKHSCTLLSDVKIKCAVLACGIARRGTGLYNQRKHSQRPGSRTAFQGTSRTSF